MNTTIQRKSNAFVGKLRRTKDNLWKFKFTRSVLKYAAIYYFLYDFGVLCQWKTFPMRPVKEFASPREFYYSERLKNGNIQGYFLKIATSENWTQKGNVVGSKWGNQLVLFEWEQDHFVKHPIYQHLYVLMGKFRIWKLSDWSMAS